MGLKNRIGEKYTSNQGYEIEIIEYYGAKTCTIRFYNGVIITNKAYSDIVRGKIKNPYHLSVLGVGEYGSLTHPKIYKTWLRMLDRCYGERHPTYIGCSIVKEWCNFQNFAGWFYNSYNQGTMQGWHLDKDILVKYNKTYSPETCCFVPQEINKLFCKAKSIRGEYPIGVRKAGDKFQAQITINDRTVHLGNFNIPEEAFQAYKKAKETYIKEIANKYRGQISEECYRAMYNYKVEIDD